MTSFASKWAEIFARVNEQLATIMKLEAEGDEDVAGIRLTIIEPAEARAIRKELEAKEEAPVRLTGWQAEGKDS